MNHLRKTIIWLTVFSIAMGFFEFAAVRYLRELYYPHGFIFPMVTIPPNIGQVEILREAATIVMLLAIGIIAGKNVTERLSFFIFCFAVWDIFYYVFLKLFMNWPESFLTWDILFLIPVPWVGPVITPCILSLTMIVLTLTVVYFHERDILITISRREWLLFITGSLTLIVSFTEDYVRYVTKSRGSIWTPISRDALFREIANYIPQSFNWTLFTIGELLLIAGVALLTKRHKTFIRKDVPINDAQ